MITNDTAWLLVEAARRLERSTRGLRMLELGNQHAGGAAGGPVKGIMTWLGVEHTSVDTNGHDGALALDLALPLPPEMMGTFDVVTNGGTTEHVNRPRRDFLDQWQVFRSIHDALATTGAVVHVVPDEHGRHGDCGYVYTHDFFPRLAACCGYELVEFYDSRSDEHHMACLMLKRPTSRFPSFEAFVELGGIVSFE